MGDMIFAFAIILIIAILLFFILRAVNLWYWRIDERVKNQEQVISELRLQNKTLQQQNALTQIMLQAQLGESAKIAINHRSTGNFKQVTISQLVNDYAGALHEYDIIITK